MLLSSLYDKGTQPFLLSRLFRVHNNRTYLEFMKKLIFILLVSLSLVQCNSDDAEDCSLVLCAGPGLLFEFVDADTGENILEGSFDDGAPDGFIVTIGEDNTPLTFEQEYVFNAGQVAISGFIGQNQVQVLYENVFDVAIALDVETLSDGGCCPGYRYENITVTNATFEQLQDDSVLILRIFI